MRFWIWITAIFSMFLICGCTTVERGILNSQTYYSSQFPNIRIDVGDGFVLRQDADDSDRYEFVNPRLHRGVLIVFEDPVVNENQVDYYHNPINWIFFKIPDSQEISKGEMNILGKKWYFRDLVHHKSSASCFLIRDTGYFTAKNDILKILYSQELPPHQCHSWKQLGSLDENQKERLDLFLSDMDQDIRISNYTTD